MNLALFEAQRGEDGKVRTGVWDRIRVPGGVDRKDGQETEFTPETMGQMIDNFVERGDLIGIDYNHQSSMTPQNGMPAPALGFYGAFAVVWGGKIVKTGVAKGVNPSGTEGLDLSLDGLWGHRDEVTEIGDRLLPNFKYLSPTFTSQGTRRDGSECGYSLVAVAATNSPFQEGTVITFSKESNPIVMSALSNSNGAPRTTTQGATQMAKLAKLAKFAGSDEGADDAAIKSKLESKMEDTAMAAASDEKFDYEGEAKKFEEAAMAYEDAHMDEADGDEPPHATMRKMAAHFRKLAKMSEEPADKPAEMAADPEKDCKLEGEKEEMAKLEADKDEAKMATMQAALQATQSKLARLEKIEGDREETARKERELTFTRLADQAIAGGYPEESRKALINFARTDFKGAQAVVAGFIPKGAPSHLFDRISLKDAPTNDRHESGPRKPRTVHSMGRTFVEDDGHFADEIKRVAESKDPVTMAKVDKLLPEKQRTQMFNRLLAADKVVRAEQPELAESAEG